MRKHFLLVLEDNEFLQCLTVFVEQLLMNTCHSSLPFLTFLCLAIFRDITMVDIATRLTSLVIIFWKVRSLLVLLQSMPFT